METCSVICNCDIVRFIQILFNEQAGTLLLKVGTLRMELSVQEGVFATQRSNEAFDFGDNACEKMMSRIGGSVSGGNWKYAHGTAYYEKLKGDNKLRGDGHDKSLTNSGRDDNFNNLSDHWYVNEMSLTRGKKI
uniref:Uncharacterized protein n=1 Tax=Cucumis melo TaxID=3656 RepID=A0A9I9E4U1_CUCME